jgi:AcrR family transcriptional regulator
MTFRQQQLYDVGVATAVARRLPPEARHRQLVKAALVACAHDGWEALSLESVAARAGVTRGLIYRYFPAGRTDLLTAVADEACNRLREDFSTDPDVELATKTQTNIELIFGHAEGPTDAWLVYRAAAGSDLPEVRRRVESLRDDLVAAIATNNLGTPTPPPLARLAIRSYLAFAEAALDDWRQLRDVDRDQLLELLASVFATTMAAARA